MEILKALNLARWRDNAALAVCLFCVIMVIVRLLLLHSYPPLIDADEAIVGLMAKHIAQGERLPFYYWGQCYMGSMEAVIVAVFYKLFGTASVFLLQAVPTLFWYAGIPFLYVIWRRVAGRTVALLGAVFMMLPGFFLCEWISKARGGYSELVFLGAVALFTYPSILKEKAGITWSKLLFGMLLGLSFWVNTQSICVILPIVLHYAFTVSKAPEPGIRRKPGIKTDVVGWRHSAEAGNSPLWRSAFVAARFSIIRLWEISCGSLIVIVPMIVYDCTHGFGFARFMLAKQADTAVIGRFFIAMRDFFVQAFPVFIGVYVPWTKQVVAPWGSMALAVFMLGAFFYFGYVLRKNARLLLHETMLFFWSFAVLLLLYGISRFGTAAPGEPRYLLTAVYFVPFCMALFAAAALKWSRIVGICLLLGIAAYNGYSWYRYFSTHRHDTVTPLVSYLQQNGIRGVYADYWILYPLIFYSNEAVLGSSALGPSYNDRYPPYVAHVRKWLYGATAFIGNDPAYMGAIGRALRTSGISCTSERVGAYTVLRGFSRDPRDVTLPVTIDGVAAKRKLSDIYSAKTGTFP